MTQIENKLDIIIKDAKVPQSGQIKQLNIGIKDQKIASLTNQDKKSENSINAKGDLVIPGAIDPHAHVYDPEYSYREDFFTGSKAASAGGVTTVFDMPLSSPVITDDQIKEKIRAGEENSIIDYGIHAGMIEDQKESIPRIKELGINSFKSFTCAPYTASTSQIYENGTKIKDQDGVYIIHSENEDLISHFEKNKETNVIDRNKSRPGFIEEIAIQKVGVIAEEVGFNYHIAHLSSKEGLRAVKNFKQNSNINISAETCPQFLTFTREDVKEKGPYLTMNPPIKTEKDQKNLWKGIKNGYIDMIATDHAPGTKEEKDIGWEDIWEAWGGLPGVQEMLPILINGVNKNKLSIHELINVSSKNAAKKFGLFPEKGSLIPGTDADLVIVDMDDKYEIKNEDSYYKVGWTPYEGIKLNGKIKKTLVRGEIVYDHEEGFSVDRGYGKFLRYDYGGKNNE